MAADQSWWGTLKDALSQQYAPTMAVNNTLDNAAGQAYANGNPASAAGIEISKAPRVLGQAINDTVAPALGGGLRLVSGLASGLFGGADAAGSTAAASGAAANPVVAAAQPQAVLTPAMAAAAAAQPDGRALLGQRVSDIMSNAPVLNLRALTELGALAPVPHFQTGRDVAVAQAGQSIDEYFNAALQAAKNSGDNAAMLKAYQDRKDARLELAGAKTSDLETALEQQAGK